MKKRKSSESPPIEGKTIHCDGCDQDIFIPQGEIGKLWELTGYENSHGLKFWGNYCDPCFQQIKEKTNTGTHCVWRFKDGHGGEWETSCGAWYEARDFGCSTIRECPKCGKETTTKRGVFQYPTRTNHD